jgi:heme oxygenase
MRDMQVHLERLRKQAAEYEMIREIATDPVKRDLFAKLAEHFRILAAEVEHAMQKVSEHPFQGSKAGEPSSSQKE